MPVRLSSSTTSIDLEDVLEKVYRKMEHLVSQYIPYRPRAPLFEVPFDVYSIAVKPQVPVTVPYLVNTWRLLGLHFNVDITVQRHAVKLIKIVFINIDSKSYVSDVILYEHDSGDKNQPKVLSSNIVSVQLAYLAYPEVLSSLVDAEPDVAGSLAYVDKAKAWFADLLNALRAASAEVEKGGVDLHNVLDPSEETTSLTITVPNPAKGVNKVVLALRRTSGSLTIIIDGRAHYVELQYSPEDRWLRVNVSRERSSDLSEAIDILNAITNNRLYDISREAILKQLKAHAALLLAHSLMYART